MPNDRESRHRRLEEAVLRLEAQARLRQGSPKLSAVEDEVPLEGRSPIDEAFAHLDESLDELDRILGRLRRPTLTLVPPDDGGDAA